MLQGDCQHCWVFHTQKHSAAGSHPAAHHTVLVPGLCLFGHRSGAKWCGVHYSRVLPVADRQMGVVRLNHTLVGGPYTQVNILCVLHHLLSSPNWSDSLITAAIHPTRLYGPVWVFIILLYYLLVCLCDTCVQTQYARVLCGVQLYVTQDLCVVW